MTNKMSNFNMVKIILLKTCLNVPASSIAPSLVVSEWAWGGGGAQQPSQIPWGGGTQQPPQIPFVGRMQF